MNQPETSELVLRSHFTVDQHASACPALVAETFELLRSVVLPDPDFGPQVCAHFHFFLFDVVYFLNIFY